MFYQQCYTNPRLNKLIYGCCNAAARTSSLLVAELVLPQASNCNTSSRGEGGGVTQSFNKKGYYSQRYPRSRFFSTSISVYFLTCRLFNLFWVMNIFKKTRNYQIWWPSMLLYATVVLIGYMKFHCNSILSVKCTI